MPSAGTPLRDVARPAPAAPVRSYAREFPARLDQVRAARRFAAGFLKGFPAAGDAVLCVSELAANAVIHSASSRLGGVFAVRAELVRGSYVRIEVHDGGGQWTRRAHHDGRPHGLDLVACLAAGYGVDGSAMAGWTSWVRLDWAPGAASPMPADGRSASYP